ncbi:MAG TPA: osmotically-inducible protein OsmY, partial [Pantoea agglomerans]|nr:osmotically-inducible protein OsmY [Pantoea agglomerans]
VVGTQVEDSNLELRATNALAKDQRISSDARIIATTYQGEVVQTGQAAAQEIAGRAKQIRIGEDGATEISSEIRIGQKVTLGTTSSDTWITTKIRSQLLGSDQVKSSNVKVTTENGEVFLLGLVTPQEAQAAADVASRVSGVKHVTTAFTMLK